MFCRIIQPGRSVSVGVGERDWERGFIQGQ